jgi:carbamoyl-phosphate synthase large subunit
MTKTTDVRKVLILGSSALKIGEAGEFDYSGSQAIKALKEEGIATILANPNVATIQTSDHMADEVYFVPITPEFIEQVIVKERPDGILLSFGGQTALNCGVELYRSGVLKKYGVKVLGTPVEAILNTEDRRRFTARLAEIDVDVPRSCAASSVEEAIRFADDIGYPCMVRVAFALGGLGSGICRDPGELRDLVTRAFAHTDQLLVEECLEGWKEIEYEVIRDRSNTCLTVCNMENLDPMGIHTGESIVVAPSQTLDNEEYHRLREVSIRIARHIGIVGECNVQFALDPQSSSYRVIEVNARLSRSSALASKATGYPLAFVAAKLGLGFNLYEVENSVTRVTRACFEPALDYIVVKAPRWDFNKFRHVTKRIGSSMKSVGEVMAIGRNFEEALQKALRMLDIGMRGLVLNDHLPFRELETELAQPTERRIFAVAEALNRGMTVERIHEITRIDLWFLHKLANIVKLEAELKAAKAYGMTADLMLRAKQNGFSDSQIGIAVDKPEESIRKQRQKYNLHPWVKQIDTLAAEYPAATNYLYLTYHGCEHDVEFDMNNPVIILGSGPYRIGSSVEFDWCCVTAVQTLRELGHQTIMLNNNPETVSTDYDECDRLYFDELSFEVLSEIYRRERSLGIVASVGGQVPNNLALPCYQNGITVLGTSPENIDRCEDRHKFSSLLEELGVDQPAWCELTTASEAFRFAEEVGFPIIVRPSYVLSGAAMGVASTERELEAILSKATEVSKEHPVVISKFVEDAKEIDIDAVARRGKIVLWAISEHVENAGVHSGDATLVIPPQRTYVETMRRIRRIAEKIAAALKITGPFNIQFIAKENKVMVIECNLRASRSFPFVSKILKENFIKDAIRVIMNRPVEIERQPFLDLDYVGVKAPQFSFTRLDGADPVLGVEMASTGEVACLGRDFDEAFLKALIAVGFRFPLKSILVSSGPIQSKVGFLKTAHLLESFGVTYYATAGTGRFMRRHGFNPIIVHWPLDNKEPNAATLIKSGQLDLVVNIPKDHREEELTNDYIIRRAAVDFDVPLITNLQIAQRLAEALSARGHSNLPVDGWREYHRRLDTDSRPETSAIQLAVDFNR